MADPLTPPSGWQIEHADPEQPPRLVWWAPDHQGDLAVIDVDDVMFSIEERGGADSDLAGLSEQAITDLCHLVSKASHDAAELKALREYVEERDALAAAAPPTAGQVLAHIEAGGEVEQWEVSIQVWSWTSSALRYSLASADPSTPQPGLRLVALPETEQDR